MSIFYVSALYVDVVVAYYYCRYYTPKRHEHHIKWYEEEEKANERTKEEKSCSTSERHKSKSYRIDDDVYDGMEYDGTSKWTNTRIKWRNDIISHIRVSVSCVVKCLKHPSIHVSWICQNTFDTYFGKLTIVWSGQFWQHTHRRRRYKYTKWK